MRGQSKTDVRGPCNTNVRISLQNRCAGAPTRLLCVRGQSKTDMRCARPLQYQCADLPAKPMCRGPYKTIVCAGPRARPICDVRGPCNTNVRISLQDRCAGAPTRLVCVCGAPAIKDQCCGPLARAMCKAGPQDIEFRPKFFL